MLNFCIKSSTLFIFLPPFQKRKETSVCLTCRGCSSHSRAIGKGTHGRPPRNTRSCKREKAHSCPGITATPKLHYQPQMTWRRAYPETLPAGERACRAQGTEVVIRHGCLSGHHPVISQAATPWADPQLIQIIHSYLSLWCGCINSPVIQGHGELLPAFIKTEMTCEQNIEILEFSLPLLPRHPRVPLADALPYFKKTKLVKQPGD